MRLRVTLPVILAATSGLASSAPSRCAVFNSSCIHGLLMASNSSSKRGVEFNWGSTKVRGVNLGGWLVLEPSVYQPSSNVESSQLQQFHHTLDLRVS